MSLINFIVTWSANCIASDAPGATEFATTDTELMFQ